MDIQNFKVAISSWPNEFGKEYWTISDGVNEKGEFESEEEAENNMLQIIQNWRCDS
ncbi:hypothetical protein JI735_34185 (plasmid) [Paenibacillus sonchi]|uniref:Uncharacterized protein n=1 Tax=Paenibacillus sonchi TaxID=373687 RepID=A0A974PJA0_9BACL|nr:hypothetical protein [Paenibacillus sonchi]QQZ64491.1 hypothetical protein JI735_34185 [Paenibacillus sonchi]